MGRLVMVFATLSMGCSAIAQVSGGGAVGAVNGSTWGGGEIAGHLGLGGRQHADASPIAEAVRRPSRLGLRVAADRAIYVSGAVVDLGAGALELSGHPSGE